MDVGRLALSEISTQQWSLQQDLDACEERGIKAIGVWNFKLEELDNEDVRAELENRSFETTNFCFTGLFTKETEEGRQEAIDEVKATLDWASELGVDTVLTVVGGVNGFHPAEARTIVRQGLEAVLPRAEELGIKLAVEPFHPMYAHEWSIVTSLDEGIELVEEFDSPALGLMIDTYHFWWDRTWEIQLERAGKDNIFGVQISDWRTPTRSFEDRTIPGRGAVPFEDIIGKLEALGYEGHYGLEIFSEEIWEEPDRYPDMLDETVEWFSSI